MVLVLSVFSELFQHVMSTYNELIYPDVISEPILDQKPMRIFVKILYGLRKTLWQVTYIFWRLHAIYKYVIYYSCKVFCIFSTTNKFLCFITYKSVIIHVRLPKLRNNTNFSIVYWVAIILYQYYAILKSYLFVQNLFLVS